MKRRAELGILGGSGFYRLARRTHYLKIKTRYGEPSDSIALSTFAGRKIAFLPRHGVNHQYPPHMVPYRANMIALKELGVSRVIGPNAVGSLRQELRPGDIVFCDQFVNFATGREGTYYDGPETTHVSVADPYCPEMRKVAVEAAKKLGLRHHQKGTVVVIQGPRFSTRAESRFFRKQDWDVVNMTQYPEVVLARELEMCYLNVSLVTDYDAGLERDPSVVPVSHEEVVRVFEENIERLKGLIFEIARTLPTSRSCSCGTALMHARVSA